MVFLFAGMAFVTMAQADTPDASSTDPRSSEAGAPTLEELCTQYETLSDQLTQDYAAIQQATLQAEREENLLPEIKANSTYTKTRIAFKDVVTELGTRSCPVDLDSDFPPLVE